MEGVCWNAVKHSVSCSAVVVDDLLLFDVGGWMFVAPNGVGFCNEKGLKS